MNKNDVRLNSHLRELRYSPFWDPLGKDPRFEPLLTNPPKVRY
jgi:hypothetical protein